MSSAEGPRVSLVTAIHSSVDMGEESARLIDEDKGHAVQASTVDPCSFPFLRDMARMGARKAFVAHGVYSHGARGQDTGVVQARASVYAVYAAALYIQYYFDMLKDGDTVTWLVETGSNTRVVVRTLREIAGRTWSVGEVGEETIEVPGGAPVPFVFAEIESGAKRVTVNIVYAGHLGEDSVCNVLHAIPVKSGKPPPMVIMTHTTVAHPEKLNLLDVAVVGKARATQKGSPDLGDVFSAGVTTEDFVNFVSDTSGGSPWARATDVVDRVLAKLK